MSQFTCPHCGGLNKVIGQRNVEQSSPGLFQQNQTALGQGQPRPLSATPPTGRLSELVWFLRGGKPVQPEPVASYTVKTESWDYPTRTVELNEFDKRVDFNVLYEIAAMARAGHDWTRYNLVKHTRLSENKVRVYQRDFKRLGYLDVTENNRSELTVPGRRFLRGILAMGPTPEPDPV